MAARQSTAAALALGGCCCASIILAVCLVVLLTVPASPAWPAREPQFVWWWLVFGILLFAFLFALILGDCDSPRRRIRRRRSFDDLAYDSELEDSSWLLVTCIAIALVIIISAAVLTTVFATTSGKNSGDIVRVAALPAVFNATAALHGSSSAMAATDRGVGIAILVILSVLLVAVVLVALCVCALLCYDRSERRWAFSPPAPRHPSSPPPGATDKLKAGAAAPVEMHDSGGEGETAPGHAHDGVPVGRRQGHFGGGTSGDEEAGAHEPLLPPLAAPSPRRA